MKECLFCLFKENSTELFFENSLFVARYDHSPVSPGHAIVFPKQHILNLLDLNNEEWISLKDVLSSTTEIIKNLNKAKLYKGWLDAFPNDKSVTYWNKMMEHVGINKQPDGFNYGNNDGEAAGRTIHHLHIHIIPRYYGDVEDSIGGIRNIIPGMGNYRK